RRRRAAPRSAGVHGEAAAGTMGRGPSAESAGAEGDGSSRHAGDDGVSQAPVGPAGRRRHARRGPRHVGRCDPDPHRLRRSGRVSRAPLRKLAVCERPAAARGGRTVSLTQYYTATTLDGFIADPDNSLEWLFTRQLDEGGLLDYGLFSADVGSIAMGATT